MEHGVNVVTPDWILDCDAHSTRLSESSYHPSSLEFDEQTAAGTDEALNGPSSVEEHDEEDVIVAADEVTESFENKTEEQEKCFPSTSTEVSTIDANNHLELKSQDWNEGSTSSILDGIVFHIIDYPQCVGEDTIEKWKKVNICDKTCHAIVMLYHIR